MTTELWLGTEHGLQRLEEIEKLISKAPRSLRKKAEAHDLKMKMSDWDEDLPEDEAGEDHWMLNMYNDLAVISVCGPMIPGSAGWWGQYFGYTGYDDIKEAVLCGINNGAKSFLFDWDTPGGAAKGIEDTSYFLEQLAEQYETISFTSNSVCSAGLWLATALDDFYGTPMSQAGSIGVVAVHTEVTKMLEMEGITKKVFRTAQFKALGSPYEKLSQIAEETIQEDMDTAHQFFVEVIAKHCNMGADYVGKELANGKVWYAADAIDRGLMTGLKTFDELLVALSGKNVENTNDYSQNQSGAMTSQRGYSNSLTTEVDMKRKIITPKAADAIASGVPVDAAMADAPLEEEAEGQAPTADAPEADAPEAPAIEASASEAPIDNNLMNQLIDAKVKLQSLETKVVGMDTAQTAMKTIVANSIQRAFSALGAPIPETDALLAMDAGILCQQHATADAQLQKRYGAGGRVSVAATAEDSAEEDAAIARLQDDTENVLQSLATFRKK